MILIKQEDNGNITNCQFNGSVKDLISEICYGMRDLYFSIPNEASQQSFKSFLKEFVNNEIFTKTDEELAKINAEE